MGNGFAATLLFHLFICLALPPVGVALYVRFRRQMGVPLTRFRTVIVSFSSLVVWTIVFEVTYLNFALPAKIASLQRHLEHRVLMAQAHSPLERASLEYLEIALQDPETKTNYQSFIKYHPQDAIPAFQALAIRGMRRLSDAEISHRGDLMIELLKMTNEKDCAGLMTGKTSGPVLVSYLQRLPPDQVSNWAQVNLKAAFLELNQRPFRSVAQVDLVDALKHLFKAANENDQAFFNKYFTRDDKINITEEEHCRCAKLLYRLSKSLPLPERATVIKSAIGALR